MMFGFIGTGADDYMDFGNFAVALEDDEVIQQAGLVKGIKEKTKCTTVRIVSISRFKDREEFEQFYEGEDFLKNLPKEDTHS